MTKERFATLLQLYYDHKLSEAELQEFLSAAEDPSFQDEFSAFIDKGLESGRFKGAASRPQAHKVLSRIRLVGAEDSTNTVVIWYKRRSYLAGAAATFLVTALLLFYLVPSKQRPAVTAQATVEQADPLSLPAGSHKATLTLADGKIIPLDQSAAGLSLRQGASTVLTTKEGMLSYKQDGAGPEQTPANNTVTTPRGGTYMLKLPDGTQVWLNADSRITYPTTFNHNSRTVTLSGEAYFEVAANAHQPFIVQTNKAQVLVLGTTFNIEAYPDLPVTSATLLSGRVQIRTGNKSLQLQPGTQVEITAGGQYTEKPVDTSQVVAWKNGLFDFHSADLGTIMFSLQKWYDIQVVFKDGMEHRHFTGKFNRSEDASTMLHIMEESDIHMALSGKTLTISK